MSSNYKSLKEIRRLIEDVFNNVHPIYMIKASYSSARNRRNQCFVLITHVATAQELMVKVSRTINAVFMDHQSEEADIRSSENWQKIPNSQTKTGLDFCRTLRKEHLRSDAYPTRSRTRARRLTHHFRRRRRRARSTSNWSLESTFSARRRSNGWRRQSVPRRRSKRRKRRSGNGSRSLSRQKRMAGGKGRREKHLKTDVPEPAILDCSWLVVSQQIPRDICPFQARKTTSPKT
jgi:hypothetical protein